MEFPEFASGTSMSERVFLHLARDWQLLVGAAPKDTILPREADVGALACLLLSVEWGAGFTDAAAAASEACLATLAVREMIWFDKMPWRLCSVSKEANPFTSPALEDLTVNVNHANSGIRI
jgi:hypothetical protein